MDLREARFLVEELLFDYVQCIDQDRLEEWPHFFTEECLYKVVPRENWDQGLPIALIYCDSRGMLEDRVVAHRKANLFAPHLYRHLVGSIRIVGQEEGLILAQSSYAVFRTFMDPVHYGQSEVYSTGEYRDKVVLVDGRAKFKEKVVIVDTCRVSSLLATPL